MKTLVIFSDGENLLNCYLHDLPIVPTKGHKYFFGGKTYEVADIVEYLGHRGLDGQLRSGYDQFVEMLPVITGSADDNAAAQAALIFTRMISVSKDEVPGTTTTASKIIVAQSSPNATDFEHVLYVSLSECTKPKQKSSRIKLSLKSLLSTTKKPSVGGSSNGSHGRQRRGNKHG
jgi:hypothetical protein